MVTAAGAAMAEAGLLLAFAPAARALAPQVTAVAPLAVFHDLRWLYGFGGAWPAPCSASGPRCSGWSSSARCSTPR